MQGGKIWNYKRIYQKYLKNLRKAEEMPLLKKVLFADAGLMSTLESSGNILSY